MRGKYKAYLFERLENYGTLESKDVYTHLDNGVYTIEHIMPQHLNPEWRDALGPNAEEIHNTWLHRLANLTLTGYNPSLSNNPFHVKRDAENSGYKASGLRMNQKIAQKESWGLSELEERNRELLDYAKNIWSYPNTSFVPVEKEYDSCSLDDEDVDLTNRIIAKYSYGQLIASVRNDTEITNDSGEICVWIEGTGKRFILPNESEYRYVITPRKAGTMDVLITASDLLTGEYLRVTRYNDLALTPGKDFTLDVDTGFAGNDYIVELSDSETIEPDDELTDDIKTFDMEISVEGPGFATQIINVLEGQRIVLKATPDDEAKFVGRRDSSGKKISSRQVIEIEAREGDRYTAVFAEKSLSDETEKDTSDMPSNLILKFLPVFLGVTIISCFAAGVILVVNRRKKIKNNK